MALGNQIGVTLINGVSYTHQDIVVNVLGVPIVGVTSIDYSDPQTIDPNYSAGSPLPTSVGYGTVAPTGSITFTMEAIQQISEIAPGGKIQNIPPFSIGVNFIPTGGIIKRHKLEGVIMKGRGVSSSSGNSQIEETVELFVANINYNA